VELGRGGEGGGARFRHTPFKQIRIQLHFKLFDIVFEHIPDTHHCIRTSTSCSRSTTHCTMYNRIPENLITLGNSIHAVHKGSNDFSLKMASDNTETVNDVRSHTHNYRHIHCCCKLLYERNVSNKLPYSRD
jgi:hypothetical protein